MRVPLRAYVPNKVPTEFFVSGPYQTPGIVCHSIPSESDFNYDSKEHVVRKFILGTQRVAGSNRGI